MKGAGLPLTKRNPRHLRQVAAVWTTVPFFRKPEDIVTDLGPARDADDNIVVPRPRPENKRVWASVDKPPKAVIEQMFQEALARDPARNKRWVVLVDGNPSQLALIKREAKRRGVEITIVLDVIHVLEYVWKAGIALQGEGDPATQRWVSERLLEILRGNSSSVAAGMRRGATLRKVKGQERLAVDICADYLLKYRRYTRYDQYLAAGLPTATGVIEGACRHLIKDRMDITVLGPARCGGRPQASILARQR